MKEAIAITQQHIAEVQPKFDCPLTRAVAQRYPESVSGYNNLWLDRRTISAGIFYVLSPATRVWLKRYDLTGTAQPFILILDHKARTAQMLEEVTA